MRFAVLFLALLLPDLSTQQLLGVVPMTGAGTPADPRRPEFAPLPARGTSAPDSGCCT